jgi:hypothetical protein
MKKCNNFFCIYITVGTLALKETISNGKYFATITVVFEPVVAVIISDMIKRYIENEFYYVYGSGGAWRNKFYC